MSPRRFSERIEALPTWKRRLINLAALFSAGLVLIAALKPIVRPVVKEALTQTLDSVYVKREDYREDTVQHNYELERIDAKLARLDSNTMCLRRRKPDWCS